MRLRNRLLVFVLAFWLPLSVVAANSMAMSMSGPAPRMSVDESVDEGDGCPQHSQESKERSPGDCYSCSFCQFACTALMSLSTPSAQVPGGWVAIEFAVPLHARSPSEPLQRPPLAL